MFSESSSITTVNGFCPFLNTSSCVFIPTKEKCKATLSCSGTFKRNSPFASVAVPKVVPPTSTVTPVKVLHFYLSPHPDFHLFLCLPYRFFSFKPHHDNASRNVSVKPVPSKIRSKTRFHGFIRCFYRQFIQTIRLLATKNKM